MPLRRATLVNVVALAVGLVALPFVVAAIGREGLARALGIGGWFAITALVDLASVLCDAFGVHGFLRPVAPVAYPRVFVAQISGLALNRLTPGNSLGEPLKIALLSRHVPATAAVSAIVMFNLATIYLGIVAIVVGVPLTAALLDLPPRIGLAMWIGAGVLVALAIALGLLVRRGVTVLVVRALARLRLLSPPRAQAWQRRAADIDGRVRELGHADGAGLRRGLAGVVGSRLCNWAGTVVVLAAAGIPLDPPLVVASLTVGILITWISNVVPLGLGLADGTNYVLYGLLGASPAAGLVFTMVNRLRTCVLAGLGLVVLAASSLAARRATASRR